MATATGQQTLAQRRAGFLGAAIVRSQKLPKQKYSTGSTLEFKLPHAGYGMGVNLAFQGQIVIGGAGGVINLSDNAPYNLFKEVKFDDYLGINRVSVHGEDLHERLIAILHAFDENNSNLIQSYSTDRYDVSIGGTGGAVATYPLNFTSWLPISLHENTTEGSFPFTVPNGDNVVSVTFNDETGSNNDAFIKTTTAGFTVTITGTVEATYYYWDVPSGTALPVEDFALVHELRRVKDSSNLTAGAEYRYPLRTGRTYYQVIKNLRLNDVGDTSDVDNVTFYIDGDTTTLNESRIAYLTRVYKQLGRDLPPGVFLYNWWRKPWTPNNYGSLETSLDINADATMTGNTYCGIFTESMYQTSKILNDLASLPGAQQA